MADQDINTINQMVDQTAPSASASLRVFFDTYNSGRDPDSDTGKRNIGKADPKDVSAELVPTLETVGGGAQNMSIEEIVTGWNGSADVTVDDTSTHMMGVGTGTTISKPTLTYPTVAVEGAINATGSTLATIKMATGDAADFAAHKGKAIEIETAAGEPMINYIADVNTTTDVITTFYPMDEVPLAGGDVKLLEGYNQFIGGGQLSMRELIFAQDFSNGASHRTVLHKVQAIGGWTPVMAQGQVVKQKGKFKIQGVGQTVDGKVCLVPVSLIGKYGLAPLAS